MGVDIISTLSRKNGANFAIALGEDIIGVFSVVASTGERDAIPTNILRTGAVVRIGATSSYFEWNGSAWVTYLGFGSGGSTIDWKESVRFATTTALAASTRVGNTRTANANGAFPTVDGVTAAAGNRFLDKDNATAADRGLWEIVSLGSVGTPWVIARTSDADTSGEVTSGLGFVVAEGTANGGKVFLLTTADPITLNTTGLTFAALSGTSVTAGNGLTGTSSLAVQPDGASLSVSGSGVKVAAGGVSATELATDAVTTAKILAANVTTAKIADAAVTRAKMADGAACSLVGRSPNSLGGPADIAAGTNGFVFLRRANAVAAALLLDENCDPAMALAGTKVSPNFGAQNILSTGFLGVGATPRAASGTVRLPHGASIKVLKSDGVTTVNLLDYGATVTDVPTIGEGAVYFEQVELSGRGIVSFCRGSGLSATQMPADTGSRVGYFAECGAEPQPGVSGTPVNGVALCVSQTSGLWGKSQGGVETSLVPRGSDEATGKRRFIDCTIVGATLANVGTTPFIAATVDCTAFNGAAMQANTVFTVEARLVVFSSTPHSASAHIQGTFLYNGTSVTQVGSTNSAFGDADGVIGTDITAVSFSVSGAEVRFNVTSTSATKKHFAALKVFGAAD